MESDLTSVIAVGGGDISKKFPTGWGSNGSAEGLLNLGPNRGLPKFILPGGGTSFPRPNATEKVGTVFDEGNETFSTKSSSGVSFNVPTVTKSPGSGSWEFTVHKWLVGCKF